MYEAGISSVSCIGKLDGYTFLQQVVVLLHLNINILWKKKQVQEDMIY